MKKILQKSLFVVAGLSLFSCVRAEKENATQVTLSFPVSFNPQAISPLGLNSGIVPASLNELNCFVALVGGPDAGLSRNTCNYKNTQTQFTVGKPYGGFYRSSGAVSSSMTFEVPNGKDRMIRLVGFKIDTNLAGTQVANAEQVCADFIRSQSLENYVSQPYIIAEQGGIVMKGEDLALDMKATLNSSYLVGDCTGPDFPNSTSGGGGLPPYKFGMMFQDGVGQNIQKLSEKSCVGLRIQVQDSAGNRANLSSNPNLTAKILDLNAGSSVGSFYAGLDTSSCTGTPLNSASNDVTVSFRNGAGQAFSDVVLFFKPSASLGSSRQLQVIDNGNSSIVMNPSVLSYVYDTSTPQDAYIYSIYDLFNNKSTLSSTTFAARNVIRAGECRHGAIQFADLNGVPRMIYLSTGTYNPIQVSATTASLLFYPSSTDCTAGTSASSSVTATIPNYVDRGSYNFIYKVIAPVPNFSFQVVNVGTATPILISGEITSGSNYWEAK